ncbi:hypothetical protein T484DRAFT_1869801 [Baffinella frigidus]|nr:hypothetical protein T484DRAFT_1869801 [Cryptophyta sp. CCMP2293]
MYVGVGARRVRDLFQQVRDLFQQAKRSSPCIIFIDEIDAIGACLTPRARGGESAREEREW